MILNERNIETFIVASILKKKPGFEKLIEAVIPDFFEYRPFRVWFEEKAKKHDIDSSEAFFLKIGLSDQQREKLFNFHPEQSVQEVLEFYKVAHSNRLFKTLPSLVESPGAPEDKLHQLEELKTRIASVTSAASGINDADKVLQSYKESLRKAQEAALNGEIYGIPTGLPELDDQIYGIREKDYILLAARPSMGKTSLALKMFLNAIDQGKVPVFFSLETPKEDLIGRLLTQINRNLELKHTIYGRDATMVNDHIDEALSFLKGKRFYIEDFSDEDETVAHAPTPAKIAEKIRKIKEKEGQVDVVFIDHIGLMSPSKKGLSEGNQSVTHISREIKMSIARFGCPFVVLSQLNRGLENRNDKRPKLSDLRDSGSLEQDADKILFVYRPFVYLVQELKEKLKTPNPAIQEELDRLMESEYTEAEIIIGKNRNGPVGMAEAIFHKPSSSFISRNDDGIDLDAIYNNPNVYDQHTEESSE